MGNAAADRLNEQRPHLRKPFGTAKDDTPKPAYGTKDDWDSLATPSDKHDADGQSPSR